MKQLALRLAKETDAPALARLSREALGYDYPVADMQNILRNLLENPAHRIFVVETDGELAGYVHCCDYELLYAPPMQNILGIAVDPAFRRLGAGRMLLDAVESTAAAKDQAGVRLVSGASRMEAHAFYRACGYQEKKDQKNFNKLRKG